MWQQIFGIANLVAMLAWIVLICAPARDRVVPILFFGPLFALIAFYSVTIVVLLSGGLPTAASGEAVDFTTIEGVRAIFASDGGATIGWVHYLAFDLFVGIWIARNADRHGLDDLKGRIVQAPILFLTFMAGPLGLTVYLLVRSFLRNRPENALAPA